jgi:7-cyano-7-deazaguanine synthase
MTRAVALLSGGLDSGTALALWRAGGGEVALALTADYGQRAAPAELAAAQRLAARLDVPWRAVHLPWLRDAAELAGSALIAGGRPLPRGTPAQPGDAASARAVWVPARNVVLVAAAAAFADALGAECVLDGFNREEAATFPDNSPVFVDALTRALAFGTRAGVVVESPTLDLDKRAIATAARAHGLRPADFWSCYEDGPVPCGRCESCARSRRAFGDAAGSGAALVP